MMMSVVWRILLLMCLMIRLFMKNMNEMVFIQCKFECLTSFNLGWILFPLKSLFNQSEDRNFPHCENVCHLYTFYNDSFSIQTQTHQCKQHRLSSNPQL